MWSESEKKVARRAFDGALKKEYAALMNRLKDLAEKAGTPEDIWAIHDFLTEQRKMIDRKYDYRYSQLVMVFGGLLGEGRITDKELEGLKEEKLDLIRKIASL
ncbi:MAG: hypothetical protein QG662_2174 [Pseudomonadota bacterium]|nr:hypothetical protein [Pseudomonadota bacterium]